MNAILIIGLFESARNKSKIIKTAAEQLKDLFMAYGIHVFKTSVYMNKISRMLDTVYTIYHNRKKYSIAIVPLYGGFNSYLWAKISIVLLKWLQKKVVVIVHGGSIPQRMQVNAKKYIHLLNNVNAVVCPSNYILKSLEQYGINATLIENVLPLDKYIFQKKTVLKPALFWMRTFEDIYNPIMAINTLIELKKTYPDATLVMAGHDRGMLQQTKNYAISHNVINSVQFVGYINDEQKNYYAKECDFYLCTNKIDNAPVSLVEMMALGLLVVTVNSGGIPYMVTDGVNGLMVNYNNATAMANKISWAIHNTDKAQTIMYNAKNYTKQYAEEAVLSKWKILFNQLP